jgi:hypothetical protein
LGVYGGGLEGEKKVSKECWALSFFLDRSKLLVCSSPFPSPTLLLDSLFLSLCIELAFNGTRELLVGVLGVAYLGATLLTRGLIG